MMTLRGTLAWCVVLFSLAGQGCGGPDFDTLCQAQEDCIGGNEQDVEACVTTLEAYSDVADTLGCTDEFDTYFDCAIEKAECDTQSTGIPCMSSADCGGGGPDLTCSGGECQFKSYGLADANDCEAEQNAFGRCF